MFTLTPTLVQIRQSNHPQDIHTASLTSHTVLCIGAALRKQRQQIAVKQIDALAVYKKQSQSDRDRAL